MPRPAVVATGALFALLTLSACSSPVSPTETEPGGLVLNIVSGGTQSGFEYTELPDPIVVQLLNAKGQPVKGQIVNFRAVQGGGSVWAGASVTDSKGLAKDWWTLGGSFGRNLLEARAIDPATGQQLVLGTVVVQPTALVNPQVQFKCDGQEEWQPDVPVSGDCYGQGGGGELTPSRPVSTIVTISVRVVHNGDTPVPGMMLDFYAYQNFVNDPAQETLPSVTPVYARTNADGIATLTFRTGSASNRLNTLQVEGPAGSNVSGYQDFKVGY